MSSKLTRHFLAYVSAFLLIAGYTDSALAQGKWAAWKHRMPVRLTHRPASDAALVPVDVTFSLFADECAAPEREIRLILEDGGEGREIPFQLSRLSRWTKHTDGSRSKPTLNGMITFFDEAPGNRDAVYYILYGNPSAAAPNYRTDLKVSGAGPAWTVENDKQTVKLHSSGQIASVVLKSNPANPIVHTERGVVHWNPGVFVPTIFWAHAWDWDPPETCEIEQGPIFVEIRRSGVFPTIPDVHLSVTYRFFSGRSYVESGTVLRIVDDIGVVALRNDQLVFDEGLFSHIAWEDEGSTMVKRLADYPPINKHGDVLRLSATAPFVTLFDPAKGIGAASVRLHMTATGPMGDPPVLFDNATYVSNGHLQYWFRPLVYFHVDWSRQQLITIPKGSVYSERNLYVFYSHEKETVPGEVVSLTRAAGAKPRIEIGEYRLPPEK